MHITGMGRFFRSIAQLNALQITQLSIDFPEEGSLDQPTANWSNLHACHGQKSCSHNFFCIAHYDLERFLHTILLSHSIFLSTRTSEAHDQSVCISVRMATLDGSPCLPPSFTSASAPSSDCVWLCARPPSPAGPWSSAPSRC